MPFASPHQSAPVPGTPKKRTEAEVSKIIQNLNHQYGLELVVYGSASPVRQKDTKYLIYRAIHYLYFSRNDDKLEKALASFGNQVVSVSLNWAPKQRADPGTLPSPSPTNPPKAKTQDQRAEFEQYLLRNLQHFVDVARPTPKPKRPQINTAVPPSFIKSDDSASETTGSEVGSPASLGSKRSFDEESQFSTKRYRGQGLLLSPSVTPSRSPFDDALNDLPTRRQLFPSGNKGQRWLDDEQPNRNAIPAKPFSTQLLNSQFADIPRSNTQPSQTQPANTQPSKSQFSDSQFSNSQFSNSQFSNSQFSNSQFSNSQFSNSQFSNSQFSNTPQPNAHPRRAQHPNIQGFDTRDPKRSFAAPEVPARPLTRVSTRPSVALHRSPSHGSDTVKTPPSVPGHRDVDSATQGLQPASPEVVDLTNLDSDDEVLIEISTSKDVSGRPQTCRGPELDDQQRKRLQNTLKTRQRLVNIWPIFPSWLHDAPLAVAWEITRICLHCNVALDDPSLRYNPAWASSDTLGLWRSLSKLDVFQGKSFPERPSAEAFAAALGTFESRGNAIVMSAALEFNPNDSGPLFLLDMKPLHFEESCRLARRFGPDRFLEVLIPSPTGSSAPKIVKDGGAEEIIRWLIETPHSLVGRQWQAFYSKDAGYRKPVKELKLGPDAKASFKERVHFFAEDGVGFRQAVIRSGRSIPKDSVRQRAKIKVSHMLDWLLQFEHNEKQPHLKLFSRIQLGLSKTFPVATFEPHQIFHHHEDILSPIGKVMNDGIGRMSRSVARKVRDALGLTDIPSAIQGRIGSAKGMWLMDVEDTGDEDWIETYPSQRKWMCDWLDPMHRTLEVRSVASELKPAGLNMQFLPVLEDRAMDKERMRKAIGTRLTNDLQRQFDEQKTALKNPLQFRQWVHEAAGNRTDRVRHGQVPFMGGLPESKSEVMMLLLNSGFHPMSQRYLQDLAWELQRQKCEILRTKLNIRVGRSTYAYMVVDFWGVLEEGEVHLGFSSKFRDELDDVSFTILAGMDVLVARSPAHFPSDIQKVRAVFKPELHALKDVIVFSAKGNVPLADKLSGGDYDGDMAWVCWDEDIVENFVNAEVPQQPNLSEFLGKDKTTFAELVRQRGPSAHAARHEAVYDMIRRSFRFAMQPNYLGICTNYKEKLCYHNNSVSDHDAILMSTLVGQLVDQSKQGIIFDAERWESLRRKGLRHGPKFFEEPAYKGSHWARKQKPKHIIDYLKFEIAKPAIDRELEAFAKAIEANKRASSQRSENAAHWWDPDLAELSKQFDELATKSRSLAALLKDLHAEIEAVRDEWRQLMSNQESRLSYPEKVRQVHARWLDIDPRKVGQTGSNRLDPKMAFLLEPQYLANRGATSISQWSLLKASIGFRLFYNYESGVRFIWQMAGYQLCYMKAQITSNIAVGNGMPVLVTPHMYAGLMPDNRFVKQYLARLEGDASQSALIDDDGVERLREDDTD
ncbi:hypothetical protein VTJ83DRAFT_2797 [Remersonia thermophila]|uniref:RNA-dependent RNA polymerase n=1 Tax=Remersonia thermophila TaxID=72144 RepID=A0ABR4DJR8_9PEZI